MVAILMAVLGKISYVGRDFVISRLASTKKKKTVGVNATLSLIVPG